MNINITINSTDLEDLERFNSILRSIRDKARDVEKLEVNITDLKGGIDTLLEAREQQEKKIEELRAQHKDLMTIKSETNGLIVSGYEEIKETMNETLSHLGLNRAFIESRIDDIESAVRYNRRNGYFKSSEQGAVYEKLSAIGNYLKEFPDLKNPVLEDFSDIHVKKLFSLDFDKIRSSLDDFKLSASAQSEIDQLKNSESTDEPDQPRKRTCKP